MEIKFRISKGKYDILANGKETGWIVKYNDIELPVLVNPEGRSKKLSHLSIKESLEEAKVIIQYVLLFGK